MTKELPGNPFTPGVGELPPVMGRRPEIEAWLLRMLDALRKNRPHAKHAFLYGLRGNGKTVLLTWLENQAAAGRPVTSAALMPKNLETDAALARALEAAVGRARVLKKILRNLDTTLSASLAGTGISAQTESRTQGPAWQTAETTLLITLDEAHRVAPPRLAQLMDAVQAAGKTSPVALVLAGTPGLEDALRASGASYWSRGQRLPVGRLSAAEAERVVVEPFRHAGIAVDDSVAGFLTAAADRYPFFLASLWCRNLGSDGRDRSPPPLPRAGDRGDTSREGGAACALFRPISGIPAGWCLATGQGRSRGLQKREWHSGRQSAECSA